MSDMRVYVPSSNAVIVIAVGERFQMFAAAVANVCCRAASWCRMHGNGTRQPTFSIDSADRAPHRRKAVNLICNLLYPIPVRSLATSAWELCWLAITSGSLRQDDEPPANHSRITKSGECWGACYHRPSVA